MKAQDIRINAIQEFEKKGYFVLSNVDLCPYYLEAISKKFQHVKIVYGVGERGLLQVIYNPRFSLTVYKEFIMRYTGELKKILESLENASEKMMKNKIEFEKELSHVNPQNNE